MHYRESKIWNRAMSMAESALRCSGHLPDVERFGLRAQLTRSAVSVPSNIAEGWARESRKEKAQFLAIAHGSLAELHTQLLLCQRMNWLDGRDPVSLLGMIDEVSRMLTVLRRKLRNEKREKEERAR